MRRQQLKTGFAWKKIQQTPGSFASRDLSKTPDFNDLKNTHFVYLILRFKVTFY